MRFNILLNITILIVSVAMSRAAPGLSGLFSIFGGINGGAYGTNPGLYGGALGYGSSTRPYGVGGGALGYQPYGGYPTYPYSGPYGGVYNPYYGNGGAYGYTYPNPVYG